MSRVYSNFLAILLSHSMISTLEAGVVTFTDIDAFRAAAGPLIEIDFTVLPDGSVPPLFQLVDITPEFNYTDLGVTFSDPESALILIRSKDGSTLGASAPSGTHTWIEAEFEPDVYAIGVTTRGILSIYDGENVLLGQAPSAGFIGFTSDLPIALGIVDQNFNGAAMTSILFQPVPEPLTLLLLGGGALFAARRRKSNRLLAALVAACYVIDVPSIQAGVVTFTDIDAFRAAAGPLVEIDFSTLPDGSQAIPGTFVDITAEFNYSDWGVTFLSPDPELKLIRDFNGSTLLATGPSGSHMWIEAGFKPMVYAVGFTDGAVFGPFLSIFDENDLLLAESRSLNGFVGMISDEPIDFALIDEHTEGVAISSILFQPVPEPLTLFLLGGGALFAARRR